MTGEHHPQAGTRAGAVRPPLALAIDVGSSSVRAALYAAAGRALPASFAQESYDLVTTGDGGVEADPEATFQLAVRAVDAVLRLAGDRAGEIRAVGMSTYWHNVLAATDDGVPLSPVYTWADTRAAGAADELRARLDGKAVHARTGCVLHPSYLPAKLYWLRGTAPALFDRTHWWLSIGEWLIWRFTGRLACGLSMASGSGLLDQHTATWDAPLLDAIGLDRAKLAPLIDADEAAGTTAPEWARRWPALAGVPWFAALGDGACANVGSGCVDPSRVALSVGTSTAMRVMVEAADLDIPTGLWCYRLDRRRWLFGGAESNAGNLHAWLTGTLRLGAAGETFGLPDGHGLTVLPFLAGERSPHWNPAARGAVVGLTLHTLPADILQAGLEAVSYRVALIWELLAPLAADRRTIVASGGAVHASPFWGQLLCDALGEPIEASAEAEASNRGAALMALEGIGAIADLGRYQPDPEGTPARRWQPDRARHDIYRAAAARQRALYDRLLTA